MFGLKNKKSLSRKIFISVLASLLVSFVLFLLGQIFFFHRFYMHTVMQNLTETAVEFSKKYENLDDNSEINESIVDYSDNGKNYIMVMGDRGNILHMVSYELSMISDIGERVRVTLDNAVYSKQFRDMELEKGDYIILDCREPANSAEERIYIPYSIRSKGKAWFAAPPNSGWEHREEYINHTLSGVIETINLPASQNAGTVMQRHEIFRAAMDWRFRFENFGMTEHPSSYVYADADTGNTYVVATNLVKKNGENQFVIAITPMQQVTEAVSVSKRMSQILFLLGILIAGIIAFIFMRYISKPILNMSKVTEKMRNLDFSEKCIVKGQDEIGVLAQNINNMSEQLDNTITQLKTANEQLIADIEHEKMLEKQRKDFVAAVSHELKTPLAVIQAYTEGIIDGISGEKRDKYLKVIIDETKKMDNLVQGMLENSRLEAGAEKMDFYEHDLCKLVKKNYERFLPTAKNSGIEMILDLSEESEICRFDLHRLNEVVENFILNALEHTPQNGKITISVKGKKVSVENTGSKIEEEELLLVWDKFYKADKSRKRSGHGTGLGLSISKNILNLHNATYGVENTNDGVVFRFELMN